MGQKVRITKSSGSAWEPLPEGVYDFRIDSTELRTSKSGNPQIMVGMVVQGGPMDGKKATNWLTITEKSMWRVYEFVEACGVELVETGETDSAGEPVYEIEPEHMVDCFVQCDVGIREFNGSKNNDFNKPRMSKLDPEYGAFVKEANETVAEAKAAEAEPETEPEAAPADKGLTQTGGSLTRRRGRRASA